jgi:hypothetical protein
VERGCRALIRLERDPATACTRWAFFGGVMNRFCILGVAIVLIVGPYVARAQSANTDAGMPWEGLIAARRTAGITSAQVDPFYLFANIAYVGSDTFASYLLIAPKEGLILVDTTGAANADRLIAGIKRLGHDPARLRYILVSRGAVDNVAGAARIKQAVPAARVGMTAAGWDSAKGLTRDLVLSDGDHIVLGDPDDGGGIEFWTYTMSGHSPGSFVTEVHGLATPGGREYRVAVGVELAPAAGQAAAALKGIDRLLELGPWDALFPSDPYHAPVTVPYAPLQLLAGNCGPEQDIPPPQAKPAPEWEKSAHFCRGWPGGPTNYSAAAGAQKINAHLNQIRAALQKTGTR